MVKAKLALSTISYMHLSQTVNAQKNPLLPTLSVVDICLSMSPNNSSLVLMSKAFGNTL